jgi:hypothetical protein
MNKWIGINKGFCLIQINPTDLAVGANIFVRVYYEENVDVFFIIDTD